MKHFSAALLLLFAFACSSEQPVATGTVDSREPIGVWYVGAPELPVREQPDEKSAVLATYQNGEAISVLADKGEWVEVRSGDGSGWAKKADLTTAASKAESEENPVPKFQVMPMPVTAPSAHGEIYFEADVNTDGDVVSVKILENTTGSDALANQNADSLRSAKFHPIIIRNERKPFKYYHKVTY